MAPRTDPSTHPSISKAHLASKPTTTVTATSTSTSTSTSPQKSEKESKSIRGRIISPTEDDDDDDEENGGEEKEDREDEEDREGYASSVISFIRDSDSEEGEISERPRVRPRGGRREE